MRRSANLLFGQVKARDLSPAKTGSQESRLQPWGPRPPGVLELKKSPQAHGIFFRTVAGNLDAMSTLTEYELNDQRRAADATNHPGGADLRQIKCHTMQSNFGLKLLKTNDGHPDKVTHIFEVEKSLQT
jgi:hypothetical protein